MGTRNSSGMKPVSDSLCIAYRVWVHQSAPSIHKLYWSKPEQTWRVLGQISEETRLSHAQLGLSFNIGRWEFGGGERHKNSLRKLFTNNTESISLKFPSASLRSIYFDLCDGFVWWWWFEGNVSCRLFVVGNNVHSYNTYLHKEGDVFYKIHLPGGEKTNKHVTTSDCSSSLLPFRVICCVFIYEPYFFC